MKLSTGRIYGGRKAISDSFLPQSAGKPTKDKAARSEVWFLHSFSGGISFENLHGERYAAICMAAAFIFGSEMRLKSYMIGKHIPQCRIISLVPCEKWGLKSYINATVTCDVWLFDIFRSRKRNLSHTFCGQRAEIAGLLAIESKCLAIRSQKSTRRGKRLRRANSHLRDIAHRNR